MTDDHVSPSARPSDIEARLRAALSRRAGGEPVTNADWGDLAGRLASSTRRRQRALAGAAALALVVGAAGGYLGEAAAAPGPVAARAGASGAARANGSTGGTAALAPSAAAPGVMCPGESGNATSGSGPSSSSDIGSATRVFIRTTTDGVTIRAYQEAPSAVSSCGVAPTPSAGSGSGTGSGSAPGSGTGGSSPGSAGSSGSTAPTLVPLAPTAPDVTVELSDDDAVGEGALSAPLCSASPDQGATGATGAGGGAGAASGTAPQAPTEGVASPPVVTPATTPTPTTSPQSQPQELATGTFGVLEGDPVWWVAVEVGPDVTSVQMAFPDGATDQMAPVDGIAVLAHRVSTAVASVDPGPDVVRGTLELLGGGGGLVATVALPQAPTPMPVPSPVPSPVPLNGGTTSVSPGAIVACPPPTTLPPQPQSSGTTEKR